MTSSKTIAVVECLTNEIQNLENLLFVLNTDQDKFRAMSHRHQNGSETHQVFLLLLDERALRIRDLETKVAEKQHLLQITLSCTTELKTRL